MPPPKKFKPQILKALPPKLKLTYELPQGTRTNANIEGECFIGAFSYINYHSWMVNTHMGRYCSVAPHVFINPGNHPIDNVFAHPIVANFDGMAEACGVELEEFKKFTSTKVSKYSKPPKKVIIGNDVWIGARATILGGVTIGDGAVIGASAVVTKDVKPYSIVAGIPAKHIRYRFPWVIRTALLKIAPWNWDLSQLPERDYSNPLAFIDTLKKAIEGRKIGKFNPETRQMVVRS